MNILVISNLFPPHAVGGYEERCRVVCDGLVAKGHQVSVLTSDYEDDGAGGRPEPGYPVARSLQLNGFFGRPWISAPQLFDVERHNIAALRACLDSSGAELIHIWNLGGIGKSLLHAAQDLRPVVTDVSDHWVFRGLLNDPYALWRKRHPILSRLWPRAHRGLPDDQPGDQPMGTTYFTSKSLRQLTVDKGFPKLSTAGIVYCGIEYDQFYRSVPSESQPAPFHFCFVGRLHPDKGVHTAIKAVNAVRQQTDVEVHLDVIGGGDADYIIELEQLADRERVHFVGRISPEAMLERYQQYHALIFPSEWEEPFALTPLEASAAGLPVIGTTTGGSKEFLFDGETAHTFQAGDVDDLVRAIRAFIADPQQALQMAQRAQERVATELTSAVMVDRIEDILSAAALKESA